jgi:hypothetical protein
MVQVVVDCNANVIGPVVELRSEEASEEDTGKPTYSSGKISR